MEVDSPVLPTQPTAPPPSLHGWIEVRTRNVRPSRYERLPAFGRIYRARYKTLAEPLLAAISPTRPLGSIIPDDVRPQVEADIVEMTRFSAWSDVVQTMGNALHDAFRSTLWLVLAVSWSLAWTSRATMPLRWSCVGVGLGIWLARRLRIRPLLVACLGAWGVLAVVLVAQPADLAIGARAAAASTAVVVAGLGLVAILLALVMHGGRPSYGAVLVVLGVGVTALFMIPDSGWPAWLIVGVRAGSWAGVVVAVALVAVNVAHELAQTAIGAYKNWFNPEAEIVQTIVWLAVQIEDRTKAERDHDLRRRTARDLEYIGARLIWDVPRRLRSGDADTDHWLVTELHRRAHSLRQLKGPLLLRVPGAYDQVRACIVSSLAAAGARDWLALPAEDPPTPPGRRGVEALASVGRSVLIPVLPVAGVVVLRLAGLAPDDPVVDRLTPLAAAWPVLAFVNWVNPKSERLPGFVSNPGG